MGGSSSKQKLEDLFPDDCQRFFGLENFGNTCYANSVLQALYYCTAFRERMLQVDTSNRSSDDLLLCLADLFQQIATHKRKTGVISPKKFILRLRKDSQQFRSVMHQDAHEFLNFLLNQLCEIQEQPAASPSGSDSARNTPSGASTSTSTENPTVWVRDMFAGKLVNQTRCLNCETVTCREERFLDLSLEIEQNSSITACIRNFSAIEMLDMNDKFDCDTCGCKQEAQRRMQVKELPPVLVCHLKRFKYDDMGRMRKLMYRVAFPEELKLCNTTADAVGADALYSLASVVVHVGAGLNHGHYISLVKAAGRWLFFDDDQVAPIPDHALQDTFGSTQDYAVAGSSDHHGYILIYERAAA